MSSFDFNDPFEIPEPRIEVPPPRAENETQEPAWEPPAPYVQPQGGQPQDAQSQGAQNQDVEQPGDTPEEPQQLHGIRFAPFNFGQQPTPLTMKAKAQDDGVHLAWKPSETPCVYRVVAQDAGEPHSPDMAEEVAVTQGTSAIDTLSLIHI